MILSGNHAVHEGGAIYVQPVCGTVFPVCFIEVDISDHPQLSKGDIQVFMENNTAEYAGDALFGGSIDYCHSLQLVYIDYLHTAKELFDFLFYLNQQGLSVISSEPYGVCLCKDGKVICSETSITKHLYPGDSFHLRAVIVGQRNGTVPGVVRAEFVGCTNTSLSALQESQRTERSCTPLTYTVLSYEKEATLLLTAENTTSTFPVDLKPPQVSVH